MDLDRKIAFKCSVNELENTSDADEEHIYGDTENVALLWEKVEKKNYYMHFQVVPDASYILNQISRNGHHAH